MTLLLPCNIESFEETNNNHTLNEIQRISKIDKKHRTIFISIASYRDLDCPNTIKSIYEKAKYPERIFVGICQQNESKDPDCFNPIYKNNIRIIRFTEKEAGGPCVARYYCSKLYNKEDYYIQIDSHTRFVKDYDEILINMIPEKKVVLSTYPNDWNTENDGDSVSIICNPKYESDMISFGGLLTSKPDKLIESALVTGGFFFTYGCFLLEVPFDPDLNQLFLGEEILFSVRLWTNGWDIFSPNQRICYHYYERKEAPKYWDNPNYQKYQPLSFHKVKYLLKLVDNPPENIKMDHNLGTIRSLEDYYKYIGFDLNTKTFTKKFCLNL